METVVSDAGLVLTAVRKGAVCHLAEVPKAATNSSVLRQIFLSLVQCRTFFPMYLGAAATSGYCFEYNLHLTFFFLMKPYDNFIFWLAT